MLFLAPEILLERELYFFGKKYILKMTRVKGEMANGLGEGRTAKVGTMEGMCYSAQGSEGGSQRERMESWQL